MWLPRAAFPVFRERQSGLLFPRVGISNRRGFQLLQPFYWAIDKTQDVTVSGDIETSLRVGILPEYRYAFSEATHGQFEVGYFNEFFRGAPRTCGCRPAPTPTPRRIAGGDRPSSAGVPQIDGMHGSSRAGGRRRPVPAR
jgi:hypothetical protein